MAVYQEDIDGNEMLQVCAAVSGIAEVTFGPIDIVLSTSDSSPGAYI